MADYENEWYKTEDLEHHHEREIYPDLEGLWGHSEYMVEEGMHAIRILQVNRSGAVFQGDTTVGRHCLAQDWVSIHYKTYLLDGTKM